MDVTLSTEQKTAPDGSTYQPIKIEEADSAAMNEALEEAVNAKTNIDNGSKARQKELAGEFASIMLDQIPPEFKGNVAEKLGLYSGISDDLAANKREKKRAAALMKFLKQCFNKSTDLLAHKADQWPKESSTSKVYALAKTLFMTLYFTKDDPDVKRVLDSLGIEVNFKFPLDDISDGDPNTESLRQDRDGVLKEGVSALKETVEQNMAIEETLYPKVPIALRYDAESNPKGIKKGQFTSMAAVNAKKRALESDGDTEKAEELVRKTSEKFFFGSVNQQLLFDTYQQVQQ